MMANRLGCLIGRHRRSAVREVDGRAYAQCPDCGEMLIRRRFGWGPVLPNEAPDIRRLRRPAEAAAEPSRVVGIAVPGEAVVASGGEGPVARPLGLPHWVITGPWPDRRSDAARPIEPARRIDAPPARPALPDARAWNAAALPEASADGGTGATAASPAPVPGDDTGVAWRAPGADDGPAPAPPAETVSGESPHSMADRSHEVRPNGPDAAAAPATDPLATPEARTAMTEGGAIVPAVVDAAGDDPHPSGGGKRSPVADGRTMPDRADGARSGTAQGAPFADLAFGSRENVGDQPVSPGAEGAPEAGNDRAAVDRVEEPDVGDAPSGAAVAGGGPMPADAGGHGAAAGPERSPPAGGVGTSAADRTSARSVPTDVGGMDEEAPDGLADRDPPAATPKGGGDRGGAAMSPSAGTGGRDDALVREAAPAQAPSPAPPASWAAMLAASLPSPVGQLPQTIAADAEEEARGGASRSTAAAGGVAQPGVPAEAAPASAQPAALLAAGRSAAAASGSSPPPASVAARAPIPRERGGGAVPTAPAGDMVASPPRGIASAPAARHVTDDEVVREAAAPATPSPARAAPIVDPPRVPSPAEPAAPDPAGIAAIAVARLHGSAAGAHAAARLALARDRGDEAGVAYWQGIVRALARRAPPPPLHRP